MFMLIISCYGLRADYESCEFGICEGTNLALCRNFIAAGGSALAEGKDVLKFGGCCGFLRTQPIRGSVGPEGRT